MDVTDIRVLIADDEALVRHALRIFVDSGPDLTVVGEAGDGEQAIAAARELQPDVVLMDLHMPRLTGIEATKQITIEQPGVRVLAVTTFSTERYVVPALRAGASGYLVKDTEPDVILDAIREVHQGRAVISPQVTRDLIASLQTDPVEAPPASESPELTARERSVVELIARGMSNSEIAQALHLSEPTIKGNLGRVMRKWCVRDRVQLLIYAITHQIVDVDGLHVEPQHPL